ncbi:MAG TPA: tripartite tricarboxylate transporter permease [Limnochordales bacterium]
MLEAAVSALSALFDPHRLMMMLTGIGVGIVVGILPGLGGTVGMAMLLPFVYGMDPYTGMALLIGMAAVIHTSDTFPSVLIGVPGSSGAQATVMDGFPLAKQGQASRALSAAFFSSLIGGLIGAFVLWLTIPIARPLVLAFGSPELFMLTMLGLSMVGILAGRRMLRGIMAAGLGLVIGMIGAAPTVAYYRFTFDQLYLWDGIPIAVLALGLFAVPEMLDLITAHKAISEKVEVTGAWLQGLKDVIQNKWLVFRSALIGVLVGFTPGLGGSVVDWISYGFAKQTIKDREKFGQGDIRGVIAPEASNNAKEGGALIPTLLFGIPGSGAMAVLLGGFVLMGIEPGPRMVTAHLDVTLTIIWTLALANVFGAAICILLSKYISLLSFIPGPKLVPYLLVIMLVGAYQSSRHWGDFLAFLALGLLGWVLKQLDWPRPPFLIGAVLAEPAERYLWVSVSRYGWSWLTHPGVIIIGLLTLLMIFMAGRISQTAHQKPVEASGAAAQGGAGA